MTDAVPARKGRWWVKVLLGLSCAAVAAMWIYAIWGPDPKAVYQIHDATWRPKALEVCKAADTAIVALTDVNGGFITNPTPEQMRERADLADKATDILEQMAADVAAIPVDNGDDRLRLETFKKNYDLVIADRRRYTASLREGKNVDYTETVVAGGPVTNVITDFTAGVKGNEIPLCSPPGDLSRYIQP